MTRQGLVSHVGGPARNLSQSYTHYILVLNYYIHISCVWNPFHTVDCLVLCYPPDVGSHMRECAYGRRRRPGSDAPNPRWEGLSEIPCIPRLPTVSDADPSASQEISGQNPSRGVLPGATVRNLSHEGISDGDGRCSRSASSPDLSLPNSTVDAQRQQKNVQSRSADVSISPENSIPPRV